MPEASGNNLNVSLLFFVLFVALFFSSCFGGPGDGVGAPGGGFVGFQVSSKSSGKPLLRLLRRKPPKPPPGPPKPPKWGDREIDRLVQILV